MGLSIRFSSADYTWYGASVAWPLRLLSVLLTAVFSPSATAAPLPDTIDEIRPSVVAIGVYDPIGSPRQQFRGTGFVVESGRLVVTNAHVLPEVLDKDSKQQLGVFSGRGKKGRFHPARVLKKDLKHDLALLQIRDRLPPLSLAAKTRVREGSEIAFTGFPLGMALGLYPVTHRGIVSAISPMAPPQVDSRLLTSKMIRAMRDPYNVLQLDATAYPGNSGSPVYDQQNGEVVGIVNSVLVKDNKEAAIRMPSGITYAIPVEKVRALLRPDNIPQ